MWSLSKVFECFKFIVDVELKDTTLSKLITTGREEVGCSTFLCRVVIALVVVGKEEKIVEEKE